MGRDPTHAGGFLTGATGPTSPFVPGLVADVTGAPRNPTTGRTGLARGGRAPRPVVAGPTTPPGTSGACGGDNGSPYTVGWPPAVLVMVVRFDSFDVPPGATVVAAAAAACAPSTAAWFFWLIYPTRITPPTTRIAPSQSSIRLYRDCGLRVGVDLILVRTERGRVLRLPRNAGIRIVMVSRPYLVAVTVGNGQ